MDSAHSTSTLNSSRHGQRHRCKHRTKHALRGGVATWTGFQRQMQERSSADMSTVPIWRCTHARCAMSCSWPPESCEWRSGWSTCTMKIAGTEVCPHSAAWAAGRDAEEVYAISPSSDQAHALTTVSEGSGRAPSGAPSTFKLRVHTSRIVTDPSSLLLLDGALATTRSGTLLGQRLYARFPVTSSPPPRHRHATAYCNQNDFSCLLKLSLSRRGEAPHSLALCLEED